MNAKEIVTYAGTIILALGVLALAQQKIISFTEATAFIGALLFPSAGHVAVQRVMSGGDK